MHTKQINTSYTHSFAYPSVANYAVDAEIADFLVRLNSSGLTTWHRGVGQTNRGKQTNRKELHNKHGKGVQYQWSPTRKQPSGIEK